MSPPTIADPGPRRDGRAAAIVVLALAALGTVAYWSAYFTSGAVHVRGDPVYHAFERAFPLADGWMAACAALGAIGLRRRRDWGFLFGLLAASSLVFLGLLDVLFNLNEGNYAIVSGAMAIEIAINVACLGAGAYLIVELWRGRRVYAGVGR